MLTEKWYDIEGLKVHCMTAGSGEPVVLLHGWGASWHYWRWLMIELADAGFAAYAPDLVGHGQTDKPPLAYSDADYDAFVRRLLAHLSLQRVILIGHSMGGYVALRYSLDHPEQVCRLVLVDPLYTKGQMTVNWLQTLNRPGLGETALRLIPLWTVRLLVRLVGVGDVRCDLGYDLEAQIALDYKRAHPRILNSLREFQDLKPRLSELSMPTLLIWGEADDLLRPSSFPELLTAAPAVVGHPIKGARHLPVLEALDEFDAVVLGFLEDRREGKEGG